MQLIAEEAIDVGVLVGMKPDGSVRGYDTLSEDAVLLTTHRAYQKGESIEVRVIGTRFYELDEEGVPYIDMIQIEVPCALPELPLPISNTLRDIQEQLNTLSLIQANLGIFFTDEECNALTIPQMLTSLETRRHRLMDNLGQPFDPADYNILKSEPGIEGRY